MRRDRGVALLIALILAVLLSLIGLSLTFSTMTTVRLGSEFENHERAVLIADGGLNEIRTSLRVNQVNDILSTSSNVRAFAAYAAPHSEYQLRNPITLLEARNTNFAKPVYSNVILSVTGLLTESTGRLLAGGPGRYFARLVDNADEAKFGEVDNPALDVDGIVLIRVIGVSPTLNEMVTHGTAIKNSVAVVEASLKADMSLALESPVVLNGPDVIGFSPDPKKVTIDGYDHSGMARSDILKAGHEEPEGEEDRHAGISAIYDNPDGGDASAAVQTMMSAVKDKKGEFIIGKGDSPSIHDETQEVRESDNPDAVNIFSPYFLNWFLAVAKSSADTVGDSSTKMKDVNLGTPDDPQIVFIDGDAKIAGKVSGCGLLVVTGTLDLTGTMDYDGLILVVGKDRDGITAGSADIGGTATVIGGMFIAKLVPEVQPDGSIRFAFGDTEFDIRGTAQIYNHSDNILMALSRLPLRVVGWREVTPEIEAPMP